MWGGKGETRAEKEKEPRIQLAMPQIPHSGNCHERSPQLFFFFFCRTLEAQAGGRGKDRGGLGGLVSLTEANEVKVGSSLGADAAGGRPDQPPQSHAARGMWYVASGKWHVA